MTKQETIVQLESDLTFARKTLDTAMARVKELEQYEQVCLEDNEREQRFRDHITELEQRLISLEVCPIHSEANPNVTDTGCEWCLKFMRDEEWRNLQL